MFLNKLFKIENIIYIPICNQEKINDFFRNKNIDKNNIERTSYISQNHIYEIHVIEQEKCEQLNLYVLINNEKKDFNISTQFLFVLLTSKNNKNENENIVNFIKQKLSNQELLDSLMKTKSAEEYIIILKTEKDHLINHIGHSFIKSTYKIIPFLMVYGLLISSIKLFENINISSSMIEFLYSVSSIAITFSIPILSGYIAEFLSDRKGFVIAVISSAFVLNLGGHILECLIIGCLSGLIVLVLNQMISFIKFDIKVINDGIFIPVIGTLMICLLVYCLSGFFIDYTSLLNIELGNINNIIIGFILGIIITVNVNIGMVLGMISIIMGRYDFMSAIMAGGMVSSLIIGMTMLLFPSIFNKDEKNQKWDYIKNGLCFLNKSKLNIMQNDKRGIYIPCLIGSGIAGALSMMFRCKQAFLSGGIFTMIFIENHLLFLISVFASMLIGMSCILIFKKSR